MIVKDLMTAAPVSVRPETTLADAARIMLDRRFSGLPVVDEAGKLAGIITEGDLLRRPELGTEGGKHSWLAALFEPSRLAADFAHTHARHVREAMTEGVQTVTPETPLTSAAALMVRSHFKRLPVVDDGRLVGILSRSDLLGALALKLLKIEDMHVAPETIKSGIEATLAAADWAPKTGIKVSVVNGPDGNIVTLDGVIFNEAEHKAVRVIAESAGGVAGIQDNLVYVDASSGMTFPAI
jgi:CBS domain-containing protein